MLTAAFADTSEPDVEYETQVKIEKKYEQKSNKLKRELTREFVEFEADSRRSIAEPLNRVESKSDAFSSLRKLINRRHRDSIKKIFEHLHSTTHLRSMSTLKTAAIKIEAIFERRLRAVTSQLKNTSFKIDSGQTGEKHIHNKRTIVQTFRTKQHLLFAKLVHSFVRKRTMLDSSYFIRRLNSDNTEDQMQHRCKHLERVLRKVVIKRLAPVWSDLYRVRRDHFTEDAIENFSELFRYYMNNRLSQAFSSIRSFVMEFQVLQVEQIHQDDYKTRFFEAIDKFKFLSEKSFDLNNLSGAGQEDLAGLTSLYTAAQELNVLEPSTVLKTGLLQVPSNVNK